MNAKRLSFASAAALMTFLCAPQLAAQQLDPRVAAPLMQMIQGAGQQCQAGNPQACGTVQQLQNMGGQLMQAQHACQQGNPQACQMFNAGAQQVFAAYQQMAQRQRPPPSMGGMMQSPAGSGQGYSTGQMTLDHQQRMQQQQQQFQQQQGQAAQQRAANDLANQRFLEQLRR